jgi:hypothetical protein
MNHLLRFGMSAALLFSTQAATAQTEPPASAAPASPAAPAAAAAPTAPADASRAPGTAAPAPVTAPEAAPAPAPEGAASATPRDDAGTASAPDAPPLAIAPTGPDPLEDAYATPAPWASDRTATPQKKRARLSETRGFAAAAQVGYAWPAGRLSEADGDELSKSFGGQASLIGELGARVTPSLFVGVYAGYARGGVTGDLATTCAQIDCSAYSARGGIAVRYRFFPAPSVQPWIGYAAGYEVTTVSMTNGVTNADISVTGLELAHFSVGLDYSDDELYAFGPVLDVGIGEYHHMNGDAPGRHIDQDITRTSLHEWITLGVRFTIMP